MHLSFRARALPIFLHPLILFVFPELLFVCVSAQDIVQCRHADLCAPASAGVPVMPESCRLLMCCFHRGCAALLTHAQKKKLSFLLVIAF